MAIPNSPLKLDVKLVDLPLREAFIFDPTQPVSLVAIYEFLKRHGSWTEQELDRLTVGDLPQVLTMLANEIRSEAIPLAS